VKIEYAMKIAENSIRQKCKEKWNQKIKSRTNQDEIEKNHKGFCKKSRKEEEK